MPPPDRRRPGPGCALPATALEHGYWECDSGPGGWIPYPWPTWSVLEQAFCRFKASAEFEARGMSYRVDFAQASVDFHRATQVNVRTGMNREVRRWPSKMHKDNHSQVERAREQSTWAAWVQADWGWVLFDNQDAVKGIPTPTSCQPPQEGYSLGAISGIDGHCFREPFWPEVLRCWPSQALRCAAHPLGRRCNFALRRLSGGEATTQALAAEWNCLKELWRQGGMASKGSLLAAYRVQNRGLLQSFMSMRQAMLARLAADNFKDGQSREGQLSVRMLWHGTRNANWLMDICGDGFDRAMASTCAYGKGCYFATSAAYSDKYACDVKVPCESRRLRAMMLAAVLVGETVQGSSSMYPPPVKPHSRMGDRFENAADKVSSPGILVTFKDDQALPAYVMIYELSSEG